MKKINMIMMLIFTVLFLCVFITGCKDDPDPDPIIEPEPEPTVNLQGKVVILQAYSSASDAAGASHSFVELYNITDEVLKLDGISLYYADGTSVASSAAPNTATEDGAWKRISLDGKTIPAKGSFLILGSKQSPTAARYQIPDNSGDINDSAFTLSNRAFKAALIKSAETLTAQNPFTAGDSGAPVSGYIDMVGAANDYQGRDLIFGFETTPARNSASEAVRRTDLTDTDDNSTDFTAARYASDGMSDEELEVRKPRNSSAGAWNPLKPPAGEYDGLPQTTAGTVSAHAGKLLILQIGASADDDNNISHSFVELFNNGSTDISLADITLQYAAGIKVESGAAKDGKWEKIALTGTIGAGKSFLILGAKRSTNANPALKIADNSGDMNIPEFKLDNRAVKVALIQGANLLTVQNPFNMDGGGKAAGYIDMIGVINDDTDQIFGWEGSSTEKPKGVAPFRITKQVGVRRTSLTDSNVNKNDFATVTYSNLSSARKEIMRPKNLSKGAWDPLAEPEVGEGSSKLMILQANTYGNANGGYESSLVELYNNTDDEINLTTGNYYLHFGGISTTGTNSWSHVIKLEGTIPPQCSFLIRSTTDVPASSVLTTYLLPQADQSADFAIINDDFKVALLQNQSAALSVANPFNTDGAGAKIAGYIDMLGVRNATGFETQTASQTSRPQPVRRTSLADSDNNRDDFAQYDNRSSGVAENQLYKYWPRNSSGGAWNPITGNVWPADTTPVSSPVKR